MGFSSTPQLDTLPILPSVILFGKFNFFPDELGADPNSKTRTKK